MKKPTTEIIHDLRRAKINGKYPIKLRVIFKRQVKYYPTDYNLTQEEYSKLFEEKTSKKINDLRSDIFGVKSRAKVIIEKLPHFTFSSFEYNLYKVRTSEGDLVQAFNDYIAVLKLAGRISTAISYECSLKSLAQFKTSLKFDDITSDFLHEYEKWMIKKGNSLTSVGIYLRSLRSVYNEAIADETISKELYPFGKRKYQIPTGRNTKKALQLSDIQKIYNYKPNPKSKEKWAADLWLFSYLCNGINMKDVARLKYKDIDGDYINILRAKTARATRSNPKPISIFLQERAKEIIKLYGNKPQLPNKYIFQVLEPGCTPEREMKLVQQFIKNINKYMKAIAISLEIGKPITTYTARHSFSTVLKRSGASIEFISDALGHADIRTTENYLDSFQDDAKKTIAASLIAFDKL